MLHLAIICCSTTHYNHNSTDFFAIFPSMRTVRVYIFREEYRRWFIEQHLVHSCISSGLWHAFEYFFKRRSKTMNFLSYSRQKWRVRLLLIPDIPWLFVSLNRFDIKNTSKWSVLKQKWWKFWESTLCTSSHTPELFHQRYIGLKLLLKSRKSIGSAKTNTKCIRTHYSVIISQEETSANAATFSYRARTWRKPKNRGTHTTQMCAEHVHAGTWKSCWTRMKGWATCRELEDRDKELATWADLLVVCKSDSREGHRDISRHIKGTTWHSADGSHIPA